jgi:hypothetical protein
MTDLTQPDAVREQAEVVSGGQPARPNAARHAGQQ